MPFIVLSLLVAVTLGGGVSFAAQGALPGDPLWGFKIGVNERMESALTFPEKEKAVLDIATAQRRIDEAARLAASGGLSSSTVAMLGSNFDVHARRMIDHVAKLQDQGKFGDAALVAAQFQALVAKNISALPDMRDTLDLASELSAEASVRAGN
jgi:hypothetical protein